MENSKEGWPPRSLRRRERAPDSNTQKHLAADRRISWRCAGAIPWSKGAAYIGLSDAQETVISATIWFQISGRHLPQAWHLTAEWRPFRALYRGGNRVQWASLPPIKVFGSVTEL